MPRIAWPLVIRQVTDKNDGFIRHSIVLTLAQLPYTYACAFSRLACTCAQQLLAHWLQLKCLVPGCAVQVGGTGALVGGPG